MRHKGFASLLVLIAITLVITLGYFIYKNYTKRQIWDSGPKITSSTTEPKDSPTVYQSAEEGYRKITTRHPLNVTLDIPETATSEVLSDGNEDWDIDINYQNLTILYCTGCDWTGGECGGILLENCQSKEFSLGNSKLSEHFLRSDPNYLVRATSSLKINDYRTIELYIETNNHQALTPEELALIEKINSSIHEN